MISGKTSPSRGLLIGFGALALSLFALSYGALGPSLAMMAGDLALGFSAQGALMTAYATGYLLVVVFGGYLADCWGKSRVLAVGLCFLGVGMLLVSLASSYARALIGMAAVGSGGGLIEMTASALTSDLAPEKRGLALNLLHLVFGLAAVSPLLLTWQLQSVGSWRSVYLGLGIANLLLLLPIALFLRTAAPAAEQRVARQDIVILVRHRRLWAIAAGQALYVVAEVSLASWAVDYLASAHQATGGEANGAISLFWITQAIGRLGCTWLADRLPMHRLLIALALGGFATVSLALLWPAKEGAVLLIGGAGLFFSGIYATTLAYAGNSFPRYSGTAFGFVMATAAAGAMVGPWAVGFAAERMGISLAYSLVPLALLGIVLVYVVLGPSRCLTDSEQDG